MMTVRQSVKLYPSFRLSSVFILVLQVVGLYYCMFFQCVSSLSFFFFFFFVGSTFGESNSKFISVLLITFGTTHTINDVFQSCRFYDVPRVLIADAMSSQALAAILGMTDTFGLDCWYRSDDVDYLQLLYCEF